MPQPPLEVHPTIPFLSLSVHRLFFILGFLVRKMLLSATTESVDAQSESEEDISWENEAFLGLQFFLN